MPVRRYTDPIWVQQIWDAIRWTLQQKQQTEISRLTNYLKNKGDHLPEISEYQIKQAQKDKLLFSENRVGQKGLKRGVISECFIIPSSDNLPIDDGYDWYCNECHLAGDVICCSKCHRVFHLSCFNSKITTNKKTNPKSELYKEYSQKISNINIVKDETCKENHNIKIIDTVDKGIETNNEAIDKNQSINENDVKLETSNEVIKENVKNENDDIETVSEEHVSSTAEQNVPTVCTICLLLQNEKDCKLSKENLNYLLSFTLNRIKMWLPINIPDTMAPTHHMPWLTEQEKNLRMKFLIYKTMDFGIIEEKLFRKDYTKFTEFHSDILMIQHNVAVYHGIQSQEMESSKLMLYDCIYDLVEIATCNDCYRHSNEKSNRNWFCIPCTTPHELVWAKQKGYCYWPAKVIKKTNQYYDVRFFGSKHLRSIVEKKYIKSIETNLNSLNIKRNTPFNNAYNELQLHQKLLVNPDEVVKLLNKAHLKQKLYTEKKTLAPLTANKKSKKRKLSLENNDIYEFHDSSDNKTDLMLQSQDNGIDVNKRKKKISEKTDNKKSKSPKKSKRSLNTNLIEEQVTNYGTNNTNINDNIINGDTKSDIRSNERQDFVSSSTENIQQLMDKKLQPRSRRSSNISTHFDKVYNDTVEKLRKQLEMMVDKNDIIKTALDYMQQEIEKLQTSTSENLREIIDSHNLHISEIKKKQWCYNCEQEAIYHCCWNTAYCSTQCQQQHWQSEHKKVCRRKR